MVCAAFALCAAVMWHSASMDAASLAGQVAQLKSDNDKLTADVASASEKIQALESESAQLRAARAMAGARLEPEPPAPAPAPPEESRPKPGFMAKMLRDPAMRKMLATQQASALRGFYSDFVKQANMTPDEADKFFKLLSDRQMALMDSSASLMAGGSVDMNAASAATNASNEAIKDLLGPDLYGQYQDFEKTLGDRIQVQQFSQQLGAVGSPLQDYQSKALIQIMSEEQATLPNLQSATGSAMQQALSMTPDQIDQYQQQMDVVNQRVYNRAMAFLTPPQLTAFKTFQQNMATAQVAGLKMTQQMIKGD